MAENNVALKKVDEYSNEIAEEVKALIKALDDDNRLAIIVALMKNTKMSYSQLKELFNLNSSSLSLHLSTLQRGGLVKNFLEKGDGDTYSYYSITDLTQPVL